VNQFRNFAVWIVIALLLFALFSLFQGQVGRTASSEISYSDFLDRANSGSIQSITITGETITGKLSDGSTVQTTGPLVYYEDQIKELRQKNVQITFRAAQGDSLLTNALVYWLPMLLLIGVWVFFIRQHQADAGWLRQGHGFRQVQGQASDREAWPRDLRGRCRRRGSQG
jgi:cell division protease FtsH